MLAVAGLLVPAMADTTITGEKKGAFFTITVPDFWNGDLVIVIHGFDFGAPGPNPGFGRLVLLWLSEDFAVAESSYSQCCWAVFNTKQDVKRMVIVFVYNFGTPNRVFVAGASRGGIVTAQLVEHLGEELNIVGTYPVCGDMAGSRIWDGAFDLRRVYDVICGRIALIDGGTTGLPAPGHPDPLFPRLDTLLATSTCMGFPPSG